MRKLIFLALILCSLCTFAQNKDFLSALYYKDFVLEKYLEDGKFSYVFETIEKVKYKKVKEYDDWAAILTTKSGFVYFLVTPQKVSKKELKTLLKNGYRSIAKLKITKERYERGN